ncbi:MAG: hypothetical protein DWB48_03735 [Nitrosomonas sp.]|nr:hypothetical protein [Nitrosomonas sp.]
MQMEQLVVAVDQALAGVVAGAPGRQRGGQRGDESRVDDRRRHGLVGPLRLDVVQVKFDVERLLEEGDEAGHVVAGDGVTVAGDLHRAVGVDDEVGVAVAPAVAPGGLVGGGGFVQGFISHAKRTPDKLDEWALCVNWKDGASGERAINNRWDNDHFDIYVRPGGYYTSQLCFDFEEGNW